MAGAKEALTAFVTSKWLLFICVLSLCIAAHPGSLGFSVGNLTSAGTPVNSISIFIGGVATEFAR